MIASLPSDTYVWSMVTFEVVGVETKKLEPDSTWLSARSALLGSALSCGAIKNLTQRAHSDSQADLLWLCHRCDVSSLPRGATRGNSKPNDGKFIQRSIKKNLPDGFEFRLIQDLMVDSHLRLYLLPDTCSNMSWQDYITTQLLGKNLKEGAIAGIDGQIWAKVRPSH